MGMVKVLQAAANDLFVSFSSITVYLAVIARSKKCPRLPRPYTYITVGDKSLFTTTAVQREPMDRKEGNWRVPWNEKIMELPDTTTRRDTTRLDDVVVQRSIAAATARGIGYLRV
jgi:hypothetical protein